MRSDKGSMQVIRAGLGPAESIHEKYFRQRREEDAARIEQMRVILEILTGVVVPGDRMDFIPKAHGAICDAMDGRLKEGKGFSSQTLQRVHQALDTSLNGQTEALSSEKALELLQTHLVAEIAQRRQKVALQQRAPHLGGVGRARSFMGRKERRLLPTDDAAKNRQPYAPRRPSKLR